MKIIQEAQGKNNFSHSIFILFLVNSVVFLAKVLASPFLRLRWFRLSFTEPHPSNFVAILYDVNYPGRGVSQVVGKKCKLNQYLIEHAVS